MRDPGWEPSLGAIYLKNQRCRFRVWAPKARAVEVDVCGSRRVPLEPRDDGYFEVELDGVPPGTTYSFRLDGGDRRPDPASRFQPQDVHGPSAVVDHRFEWTDDAWAGLSLPEHILYELHVGTFTPEGTFDAVIPHLDRLADLSVTAVELMPVAQFPGSRNWGYDGVLPYAVQNSYGGPEGLKRLVDACHGRGLAVVLDVVYNHLGPEGNYLSEFGPYFTERYKTPWGLALNYDGPCSDPVRRYFLESALSWIADYHVDGLRLDAVHAIADNSERPFLQELGTEVRSLADRLARRVHMFPESDRNTLFYLRRPERGGCGFDAQWTDDFHHSLHTLLTGEQSGYYQDFGSLDQMATAMSGGFVYTGQYSPYRRRRHGVPAGEMSGERHVVCSQNHDQTGNRMNGERLASLTDFESLKLAAGAVLLSPFLPLLFMGEEYGETAPFLYFVSHSDEGLIRAVREGRKEEFTAFGWTEEPPDPQSPETFERSRIDPTLREQGRHAALHAFYKKLIRLRKTVPALARTTKEDVEVTLVEADRVILVRRRSGEGDVLLAFNFAEEEKTLALPEGDWRKLLDSAGEGWGGPGEAGEGRIGGRAVAVFGV
ncbi:MAG TPA: malto-oligosyltrehalose trehalohydrolase [Thermoanaerobaculia bacterium]|nr:malto-oligosyltrehalose trehalohydrolase [Thermoanaerobaculia bacterium]